MTKKQPAYGRMGSKPPKITIIKTEQVGPAFSAQIDTGKPAFSHLRQGYRSHNGATK